MDGKRPCTRCGAMILPITAEETKGLCRPCSTGTREQVEQARLRTRQEREERENPGPTRRLWLSLINRIYHSPTEFQGLSKAERLYWAVNTLSGEVYNGGFDQYFTNSSGDHYFLAAEGLMEVGAVQSLQLLRQAAQTLFPAGVPANPGVRNAMALSASTQAQSALDQLDRRFWADPDDLGQCMEAFAARHGLLDSI